MDFTPEQISISQEIEAGHNVIVQAVAGSGKTSTCKCVLMNISKRVLIILFNKELAQETRNKFRDFEPEKLEISTLHSCVARHYSLDASTDEGLHLLLDENISITSNKKFDLIICDEAQDYSELNARVIQRLINDMEIPQILIMGDVNQCIYQFRNANPEYLCRADEYFKLKGSPSQQWVRKSLTKTFRCPAIICNFVDQTLGIKMVPHFGGGEIVYKTIKMFDERNENHTSNFIVSEIENYLKSGPDCYISDIAVLTYSLRLENSPVSSILNDIVRRKRWPIYVPREDQEVNSKLMFGKLVFSTFHAFKGRERKIIFLLGIDNFLTNYLPEMELRNVLYVAMTRATKQLYLVQNSFNTCLKPFREVEGSMEIDEVVSPKPEEKVLPVTRLIRHLPHTLIKTLKEKLCLEEITFLKERAFKRIYKFEHLYEDVSSICGDLILEYKRYLLNKEDSQFEILDQFESILESSKLKRFFSGFILDCQENYSLDDEPLKYLSNYVNIVQSFRQGVIFPICQVNHYDWIKEIQGRIKKSIKYLQEINHSALFEFPYFLRWDETICLNGRADILQNDTIYEIKFTSSLTTEHILQLAIYLCLDYLISFEMKKGVLLNVMTGQRINVTIPIDEVQSFLELIIETKVSR